MWRAYLGPWASRETQRLSEAARSHHGAAPAGAPARARSAPRVGPEHRLRRVDGGVAVGGEHDLPGRLRGESPCEALRRASRRAWPRGLVGPDGQSGRASRGSAQVTSTSSRASEAFLRGYAAPLERYRRMGSPLGGVSAWGRVAGGSPRPRGGDGAVRECDRLRRSPPPRLSPPRCHQRRRGGGVANMVASPPSRLPGLNPPMRRSCTDCA